MLTFEGSERLALEAYEQARELEAETVRMRDMDGLIQLTKTYSLDNGVLVFVVSLEGFVRTHLVAPQVEPEAEEEEREEVEVEALPYVGVPDYVCGVVDSPRIVRAPLNPNDPNSALVDNINAMRLTELGAERCTLEQARRRMAVRLPDKFKTLGDNEVELLQGWIYSVHKRVRPGNYSGIMRQVIQLLLGLGNVESDTHERRLIADGELEPLTFPVEEEPESAFGLYPEEEESSVEVTIHYDYRAAKTHGLAWGTDGRCYLLEIGQAGVYLKPFPVDPVSVTEAGRERYAAVQPELFEPIGSEEDRVLFDVLGGFPTGEAMPIGEELERLVKAGDIIRLKTSSEMQAFYGHNMYTTSHGWAIAPSGGGIDLGGGSAPFSGQAAHTCWDKVGDIKYGYLYVLSWQIGEWAEPEPPDRLDELIASEELTEDWQLRKAARMTDYQVQRVLSGAEEFDDIEVDPLATVTSSLILHKSGPLYHAGVHEYVSEEGFEPVEEPRDNITLLNCHDICVQPQIKFPEEVLGYNLSFDFLPSRIATFDGPECNMPMFVCWKDNTFVQVNYVRKYQRRDAPAEPIGSREECQYTGKWTVTGGKSEPFIRGNFWTTFNELRKEVTIGGGFESETTGRFAGTRDRAVVTDFFGVCYQIDRYFYFTEDTTTKYNESTAYDSAVAIPFGDRNLFYTAQLDTTYDAYEVRTISEPANSGHGSIRRWGRVRHFICHWNGTGCPSDKDDPFAFTTCVMREIQPEDELFSCFEGGPGFPYYAPCAPGDWFGFEDDADCIYQITFNDFVNDAPAYSSSTPRRNIFEYDVKIFGDTPLSGTSVFKGTEEGGGLTPYQLEFSIWWLAKSPTPCNTFSSLHVAANHWGEPLLNYEPQFDANVEHYGMLESMHGGVQATYVGYIS